MNRRILYLFIALLSAACSSAQTEDATLRSSAMDTTNLTEPEEGIDFEAAIVLDSAAVGINFVPDRDYSSDKRLAKKVRDQLGLELKDVASEEQSDFLQTANDTMTFIILNSIIPHWYNTTWDFNGYTAVPNSGTIACGYFVSTTLRDIGLNVNRYKLAQQGPKNEAKTLAIDDDVLACEGAEIERHLNDLDPGLYFVGLDNHVGYLYKNVETYFIHSNYIDGYVMIENTKHSDAFSSSIYYITEITGNRALTKKWLDSEVVKVVAP